MKHALLWPAVLGALLFAACCRPAAALGMEDFGNKPLSEANYKEWPGIMGVVNHPSRVYHWWVNGNEEFYFLGDMAALNETLRLFAEAKSEGREVVLRPGPGVTRSFDRSQTIAFGWDLHLIGGIARHESTLDQGDKVWPLHPVLTLYVGGVVDLEKLQVPPGLPVISVSEVKRRTLAGLKSTDPGVRGWTNGVLAELDPYDAESRDAIAGMLKDKDNWVRLNAVHSLEFLGQKAQPALPQLRATMQTDDAQLKEAVQKAIQTIEKAEDVGPAEKVHRETMERIQRFLAARKG
jgi:hypothetical protein